MTTLHLQVDDEVAQRAKELADEAGQSVGELFAQFVAREQSFKEWKAALPPITRSLVGIAPPMSDEERERVLEEELLKKYGR
jgi:hypothetical protein